MILFRKYAFPLALAMVGACSVEPVDIDKANVKLLLCPCRQDHCKDECIDATHSTDDTSRGLGGLGGGLVTGHQEDVAQDCAIGLKSGTIAVGDTRYARVTVSDFPESQDRVIKLKVTGAFRFGEGNDLSVDAVQTFPRLDGDSVMVVPVQATQLGLGSVEVLLPYARKRQVVEASVEHRPLVGLTRAGGSKQKGLSIEDSLIICSTAAFGTEVQLESVAGASVPAIVQLGPAESICPHGYTSSASASILATSTTPAVRVSTLGQSLTCSLKFEDVPSEVRVDAELTEGWYADTADQNVAMIRVTVLANTVAVGATARAVSGVAVTVKSQGIKILGSEGLTDTRGQLDLIISAPKSAATVALALVVDDRWKSLHQIVGPAAGLGGAGGAILD